MPFLQKFVEFQISNCIACLNRRSKPPHNHKIHRSVYSGEVLETVYIDHIGPITASKFRGKTCAHILILVDAFSRFTFAYPVADCSTATLVETIAEEFVPRHGLFRRLVSDRGSAFTSNIYLELCEKLGILQYHIPVRNPQSNPQERYNQNLIKYLRTDLTFDTTNWPKKLDYAVLCANTSHNKRLGQTPFFAFHGRDPILPIDLFNPIQNKFDKDGNKSFSKVIERIEQGWKMLRDNTNNYLRITNLHRQDKPLSINTICYVFFNIVKSGISKKLQSFFLGPMIITEKYSNALYLITPLDSCPIKTKKPLVVARDKIYPMETKLELCPKEWINLDLRPSEIIHPDDCILLDRKLFNNIQSFSVSTNDSDSVERNEEVRLDTTNSEISETPSVEEVSIHDAPSSDQVSIVKLSSKTKSTELDLVSDQKGEGDFVKSIPELVGTKSKSVSTKSDSAKLSKSSDKDTELTPSVSALSVEHQKLSQTKHRVGRPLGSVKSKISIPSRRSARLLDKITARTRSNKANKHSVKDKIHSLVNNSRARSRSAAIESARSRPGSRQISDNEEDMSIGE